MATLSQRPRFHWVLLVLLIGALALSGCEAGGDDEPAMDEQPVTIEATSVPEAEDIEETDTLTETDSITETSVTTETEVSDEVEATVQPTDVMTETQETGVMTETEEIDATETTTATTEAEQSEQPVDEMENGAPGVRLTGITNGEGALVRGSTLLDYSFNNQSGEVSGDLEDLLIDASNGNILFASIEYGGFLDLGDKDIVVPFSAFSRGPEDELVLNFDEQTLESFPDVGNDWPDITDDAWDDDVDAFWRENNFDSVIDFDETNTSSVMWLSDMTSFTFADIGEGVGTIQDVLVDMGNSRIKYLLLGYGASPATDLLIVPYEALDVQDLSDAEIALGSDIDLDMVQTMPRFEPSLYPDTEIYDEADFSDIDAYWDEHGIEIE